MECDYVYIKKKILLILIYNQLKPNKIEYNYYN